MCEREYVTVCEFRVESSSLDKMTFTRERGNCALTAAKIGC